MYRVKDPVFAMAESSFLDGGSRLDDVALDPLTTFSGRRPVATPDSQLPDVGRCQSECARAVRAPRAAWPGRSSGRRTHAAICSRSAPRSPHRGRSCPPSPLARSALRLSRKKPMISSVDLPFRAISTSPHETSEIAGFAPHTWCRIRDAGHSRATWTAS